MSVLTYRNPLTDEDRETFLQHLREGHSIRSACDAIGRKHSWMYRLRNGEKDRLEIADEAFAAAWDAAVAEGKAVRKDRLQEIVYDIAVEGEKDSDRLKAAEIELRRLAPEEYRDGHLRVDANIKIERREVSLHGVLAVLADAGALDGIGQPGLVGALAPAREVLPAQPD